MFYVPHTSTNMWQIERNDSLNAEQIVMALNA